MTSFATQPEPVANTARLMRGEIAKLRGSLVVLLSLAVPGCVLLLSVLVVGKRTIDLAVFLPQAAMIWGFAMLPLGITALSVVLAQIEHGARGWDHLLALPRARRRIFAIKAVSMLAIVGLWSIVLFAGLIIIATLGRAVLPDRFHGTADVAQLAALLAKMYLASWLMCMIQLWVALWFRGFVIPMAVGIGGVFLTIGVAAMGGIGAPEAQYFPWMLPLFVTMKDSAIIAWATRYGMIGGTVALIAMSAALQRRTW